MYKEKKKKKSKISVPIIAIFLVLISANMASATLSKDDVPDNISVENFGSGVTDINISNNTAGREDLGWPELKVTAKSISPSKVRPGNWETLLSLTISEIRGDDWAKDVRVIVEILDPRGTSFSETGTNRAEHYLGNIDRRGSNNTYFAINVNNNAQLGSRTVKITLVWYETGWLDLGTSGPYYEYAFIDFTVLGVKVTSPNGGENWKRGTTNTITWNYVEGGPYVKIELLKGGTVNNVISANALNDGSLDWYIPADQPTGNDYKIRITSTSDPIYTDTSNNNFVISSPTTYITVLSPNGRENWLRGTSHDIRWASSGIGPKVRIQLYKGGQPITYDLTSSTPNDGVWSWPIWSERPVGTDYKVKITGCEGTSSGCYTPLRYISDISDNNFIISNIRVTSPNGGENWRKGTTHTIIWTSAGRTGSYVKIELFKSGILNRVISSSTPNDGSFSWVVPSTQTGSDYKIKITSTSNSAYNDLSNNYFRIYQ